MYTTSGEFTVHRVVQELSGSGPTPPERLQLLYGFLDKSWRDDYIRLYGEPDLQNWLLIPTSLVHRIEQVEPTDQNAWGEDRVWISRQGGLVVRILLSPDEMPAGASPGEVQAVVDALLKELLGSEAAEKFGMSFIVVFTEVTPKSGCTGPSAWLGECH